MGQGGYVTLVNGTDSAWRKVHEHEYQMNSWSFPDVIEAGSSARIYVEWQQSVWPPWFNPGDDGGEAQYRMANGKTFTVQARAKCGFKLQVHLDTLATRSSPAGTTIPLGWQHDGVVNFILAGTGDDLVANDYDARGWMQDEISNIGDRTLREIAIPGSHDSGMSVWSSGTALAAECNTLTQSYDVAGQLKHGVRYFDIRPVISAGAYYTGHYGKIGNTTWQGANGQSIQQIVQQVNSFTAKNRELVILNLSHTRNTDVGNASYRQFNASEWQALFEELSCLDALYHASPDLDLTNVPIRDLLVDGSAVVVIVEDDSVDLGAYAGRGIFPGHCLEPYNRYAESNDVATMEKDQFDKMRAESGSQYFLLSWTLTQSPAQAATCGLGVSASIKALANDANDQLPGQLLGRVPDAGRPNIIYTDNVVNPNATLMAIAVNTKIVAASKPPAAGPPTPVAS